MIWFPLIASNVSGLAQVVSGGGILFDAGNVQDLIDMIANLESQETATDWIERGKLKAKQNSIENMVQQTIDLYSSLKISCTLFKDIL